jgi:hypothetical protein
VICRRAIRAGVTSLVGAAMLCPSHRTFLALTYLVLAVALGFVVMALLPSVGRALGWTEVRTVSRTSQHTTSANRAGAEALAEKERTLGLDDLEDDNDPDVGAHTAIVRASAQIFAAPGGKKPVGTLPRGTLIHLLGEKADFFHVLYDEQGEAAMGWVKKSDVLVR